MNKEWNKLEGSIGISIYIPKKYKVDFDKVNNFNDLKNIVEVFFEGLNVTIDETSKNIDDIREYLIEVK